MQVLEWVASQRGKPQTIRVNNGPEFISRSLDLWAYSNGVKLDFSRPGKPTDNAFIESFNGRLRDECLSNWFLSLDEARAVTEACRDDYFLRSSAWCSGQPDAVRIQAATAVLHWRKRRRLVGREFMVCVHLISGIHGFCIGSITRDEWEGVFQEFVFG